MASSKASTVPSVDLLKTALERYTTALDLKASHSKNPPPLASVDGELSSLLSRDSTLPPSTKVSEGLTSKATLVMVLQWKLARGKFRPTLPKLLDSNEAKTVEKTIGRALELMNSCRSTEEALASGAVEKLAELKGVGPATASAYLSFLPPHHLPFFSDEAASFFPALIPLKYTIAQYKTFVTLMSETLASLPSESWDMQRLERALYAVAILRREDRGDLLGEEVVQASSSGKAVETAKGGARKRKAAPAVATSKAPRKKRKAK